MKEQTFDPYKVLKFPKQTEKALMLMESQNKIIFIVSIKTKKDEIKKAVEELFKVKVDKVNTVLTSRGIKKAYVKLNPEYPAMDISTKLGLM